MKSLLSRQMSEMVRLTEWPPWRRCQTGCEIELEAGPEADRRTLTYTQAEAVVDSTAACTDESLTLGDARGASGRSYDEHEMCCELPLASCRVIGWRHTREEEEVEQVRRGCRGCQ